MSKKITAERLDTLDFDNGGLRVGQSVTVWTQEGGYGLATITAGDLARLRRFQARTPQRRQHLTERMAAYDREVEARLLAERQAEGAERLASAREAIARIAGNPVTAG